MLDFLLVIPTLNEEKYIDGMLKEARLTLKRNFRDYRMVVIDASSRDNTLDRVRSVMRNNSDTELIRGRKPHNRGADVMHAFSRYDSRMYCYIDADLKHTIRYLPRMIESINDGCDLVTGSRYLDVRLTHRPKLRLFASRIYNRVINLVFKDGIMDHQCGLKVFDRKALGVCQKLCEENHWAWDTEVLLACKYCGLNVCERPVYWMERRSKSTNIKRLVNDTLLFIPAIARMFYRFRVERIAAER